MAKTLEPRLVEALSVALRLSTAELTDDLDRVAGVTIDQWRALRNVAGGDGVTMGELSERLQLPAPTCTRIIDAMVDRGLAYRSPGGVDKRRVVVRIAPDGQALLPVLEGLVERHEQRLRDTNLLPVDALIALLANPSRTHGPTHGPRHGSAAGDTLAEQAVGDAV